MDEQSASSQTADGGVRDGQMARLVREKDWSRTPLGPMTAWPRNLRAIVEMMLEHPLPMIVRWGPELIQIYNDGYARIAAEKHPAALGMPARECWPDAWEASRSVHDRVMNRGESTVLEDRQFLLERDGTLRDAYFTLAYSPARNDDGSIGGVIVTALETTAKVLGDRDRQRQETQRLEAERELHRYRLLASHSHDIVLFMRRDDGRLLEVNAAGLRAYGYSREELLKLTVLDLRAGPTLPLTAGQMAAAEAGGIIFETVHRRKDGSTFPVEVSSEGAMIDGTPTLISVVRDISERNRAAEELRQSEEKYRNLFQNMAEEVHFWQLVRDDQGRIKTWRLVDANPPTLKTWGRASVDEIRGKTTDEIFGPGATEHYMPLVQRIFEHGEPVSFEDYFPHLDKHFRFTSVPLGEYFITTGADITRVKKAEEAMRQSEERYRLLAEQTEDFVQLSDTSGQVLYVSPSVERRLGLRASDLAKGSLVVHVDDQAAVRQAYRSNLAGQSTNIVYRVRQKDGPWLWLEGRCVPIRDAGGNAVKLLLVSRDITERKEAEEQLKTAKAAAESASRAKDQFIAVLSHELRTPLTPAVAAMSLLLADRRLPADVREDIEMVSRNLDLEVRLIADLLDVSRIISGKLHVEKRPVDAAIAIREAAAIVGPDLDAKSQVLGIDLRDAPYRMFGDAARLQQVFWNLLRNSIKFSPLHGRIMVRARVAAVDHCPLAADPCPVGMGACPLPRSGGDGARCEGNLIVEVIDSGSGIAPDALPRLFNAFEQEQKARAFGGLGLGLSICKGVVEMHGGTIAAHSDGPGRGAVFTVRLPVAQCPRLPVAKARERADAGGAHGASDRASPVRILLVEDHADTARLLRRLLMSEGHDVLVAQSVAEGLAAARTVQFDLLISDVGLPDGTGLDLMRQFRADGLRFPGIALSGYGAPTDIEDSLAAGFAEHLVKPLSGIELITAAMARLGFSAAIRRR